MSMELRHCDKHGWHQCDLTKPGRHICSVCGGDLQPRPDLVEICSATCPNFNYFDPAPKGTTTVEAWFSKHPATDFEGPRRATPSDSA